MICKHEKNKQTDVQTKRERETDDGDERERLSQRKPDEEGNVVVGDDRIIPFRVSLSLSLMLF